MNIRTPNVDSLASLYADIESYYTKKVLAHGATARGVDWGCTPTQELRFVQLLKLCDFNSSFSLNDVGCGYGALLGYLRRRHRRTKIDYLGLDVSPAMIDEAQRVWRRYHRCSFIRGNAAPRGADYSVASGVFNVKQHQPLESWSHFIQETLQNLHTTSRQGFAINFLAPIPKEISSDSVLYRCPPDFWLEYCKEKFNSNGRLINNYGMNEFTLIFKNS